MNTIQLLEPGSTELDPTLVNIWQSDQGSPRFISLHGIALRTALPGCACLLQAKPAAGTRDGWKTCGRIGETAGHPDGHPPQRALPDTFRWIGTAVDWESRDQNKALGRGVRIVGKPAHQPDGVDVRSVSLELFLNGRQVAWRAASTLVARPEELHSPQLAERRPDHGAPSSNSTGAGSREETPPTGPQGDVGGSAKRPFALGASKPVREEVPAVTGERTVGQPAGRHGLADAANGTSLHHTFPPSCGITTVTRR